jgi:hypothetical protein
MSQESNKELIVAGLYKMAWSFPLIFSGPALFIGKGTTGAWYWTVLAVVLMLAGVGLGIFGLKSVMKGFFRD